MLIDDIIKTAAQILNLSGVSAALQEKNTQDEDVLKLLTCTDFILDEVARDYFPLFKREDFFSADGRVEYTAFSRVPIGIAEVKSEGETVAFTRLYDSIKARRGGELEIKYCFKPAKAVLGQQTEWEDETPGLRILAYGVAAEYCVMSDMSEEAALWDKRYRDALERAGREKTTRGMTARRWFV